MADKQDKVTSLKEMKVDPPKESGLPPEPKRHPNDYESKKNRHGC